MEQDTRLRYFYVIEINNIIYFKGYLLHDEAWTFLIEIAKKEKQISICYEISNTSIKSDKI